MRPEIHAGQRGGSVSLQVADASAFSSDVRGLGCHRRLTGEARTALVAAVFLAGGAIFAAVDVLA